MSQTLYFQFEDEYHKLVDVPLIISPNIDIHEELDIGYLTSKALEIPNNGFIYNFRCCYNLFDAYPILMNDATRCISVKKAYPANTKVVSKLYWMCL